MASPADGADAVLRTDGVARTYGGRPALAPTDLVLAPGRILGLVGPNGSGKTTLLKLVGGFLRPDAGRVRLLGFDPFRDRARAMERARFAFAPPALFVNLTPLEHLRHLAGLHGRGSTTAGQLEASLRQVGLWERAHDRVRTFSFGMRQRLALALALVPMPELLVLDEPTDGLDPLGIIELRELLLRLRAEQGVSIVFSSHLLAEVEELVDDLLVLGAGRTLFSGPPAELRDGLARVRLASSDDGRSRALLAEHGHAATPVDGELELAADGPGAQEVARLLGAEGLELRSYRLHVPTLEEALLARMGAAGGRARA